MTNTSQTPQVRASSAATELEDFSDERKVAKSEKSIDEEINGSRGDLRAEAGLREKSLDGNVEVEKEVDVPPDGGYGWVCVACCAFINA